MGSYSTRLSANMSVDLMQSIKFSPKTILNIGVGSCPELAIWRNRLPSVALLGVDVRGQRRWNAPFVNTLVGKETIKDAVFCVTCKSLKCLDTTHRKAKSPTIKTIDDIVAETNVQPPFFMWMDIEGSELDALQGASKTLVNTPVISLEMREFPWTTSYCNDLHSFLVANGYFLVDKKNSKNINLEDKLYQRNDWKISA